MERFRKILEIASNLAIVLVVALLGVFVFQRNFDRPIKPSPGMSDFIKPGSRLAFSGLDWGKSDRNLLLVLSANCRFCTESSTFYRRIVAQNDDSSKLRILAVFPQETNEAKQFLIQNEITVDAVVSASPAELMVKGTPSLLLVDSTGIVQKTWVGKIPPEKEPEVLSTIFDWL